MENIKDWLELEYITKKRTCNDISKELNKDPKTIWSWLKKNNIPTRPRGGDSSSGSFKKGTNLWIGKKHKQETKDKIRNARLKDGHVPYLNKDGIHWLKGVTGKGHPSFKGGLTPERQSFYSSEIWADVVKKVWKRDNAICQNCGKNHNTTETRGTFHIHHIVSFMIREKRAELSNLVLLCVKCHRWVHSKKNINKKFIENYDKN
jgi:5-methylcytosine-specific restriction endonuclease McrA